METALAHWIYDLLVREAEARENHRDAFVHYVCESDHAEWRFGGKLGGGGKFWSSDERYYVSCYREDETPERAAIVQRVNATLERVRVKPDNAPPGATPCPKCGAWSGDDWSQCGSDCPVRGAS